MNFSKKVKNISGKKYQKTHTGDLIK